MTQACWELGSAGFGLLNIRAVRRSKSIAGVHWAPTAFFTGWGIYNLWFYRALHLPVSWWAGMVITAVNLSWLSHVAYYMARANMLRRPTYNLWKVWDYSYVQWVAAAVWNLYAAMGWQLPDPQWAYIVILGARGRFLMDSTEAAE